MEMTHFFFLLSRILLFPLLLALSGLVIWTLLEFGGFLRELFCRGHLHRNWKVFCNRVSAVQNSDFSEAALSFFEHSNYQGFVGVFSRRGAPFVFREPLLEKNLSDIEIEAFHAAQRMNLGVRLGPALGLIGTLIPLGPAMLTLSSGQLNTAASDLAVAFATTIVGLLCSVCCYIMFLVRSRWYAKDVSDIEYVFALLPIPCGQGDEK